MNKSNISQSFITNLSNMIFQPQQLNKTKTHDKKHDTNTHVINHPQLLRPLLPKSRKLPKKKKK